LLSGDGDFEPLLHKVRASHGVSSVVVGVPQLSSRLLVDAADEFWPIDDALLL